VEKIIHILFDETGAANLQTAFEIDPTLKDEVVVMEDDWSVGPLSDIQEGEMSITREEWLQHFHPETEMETNVYKKDNEKLQNLAEQLNEDDNIHLWIWAAQNAQDVCGYYWLLDKVKNYQGRLQLIYLNNLPFLDQKGQLFFPVTLAEIPPKEFPKAKRLAREITPAEIETDTDEFLRLKEIPSLIRTLEGAKKVKPLPDNYYDDNLVNNCTSEWQKAGKILHHLIHKSKGNISEAYLLWRLKELVKDGKLVYQGELKTKKDFEVRLSVDVVKEEMDS
jgi:Domain of unknown function (DUF1835)/Protein of unknown function